MEDTEEEEVIETGQHWAKVYWSYLRAGGTICFLIFFWIIVIVSQTATSGADYWVGYWTNMETIRSDINTSHTKVVDEQYEVLLNNSLISKVVHFEGDGLIPTLDAIYIYTFVIVACILLCLLRNYLFTSICMSASRSIHNSMFANLLQTTMYFFNTNPSGKQPLYLLSDSSITWDSSSCLVNLRRGK